MFTVMFTHPLCANLDLWPDEVAVEQLPVLDLVELADCLPGNGIVHFAALLTSLLL